ncbi:D-alanyl-D-alanine carboxypeptidase [Streptomyces aurantiacus]|uniref:serine-type D-Ala-D-Ala carboxypeptidase n=1 Tax=Streptomyces aurantiacus TaxID=47760 RepID=A0A7G1P1Z6_9ACTN|nr:D-alanyl-D-alanine carboxypeptidase [Streptomyces aurantiacus]BCL28681.1 D-alanyl-D-alanine carboxypeptidase [Streptomyces aurantiacus]
MAGESPDRSKQHESSAGATSGSKAPVPDPRLAVAREAVTAAARVDTATAVFSTKRSAGAEEAGAEEAAGPAAGSSQGSDGSAEPESAAAGAGKGTGGGDARLRNVVAAWAATADDEAPEGASADADEGSDLGGGSGAGADSGSGSGSDGSDADSGAPAADGSDADEDPDADTGVGAAPGSEPEGAASVDASAEDGETAIAAEPDVDADADADAGAGAGGGTSAEAADETAGEPKGEPASAEPERPAPHGDPSAKAADVDVDVDVDADAPSKGGSPAAAAGAADADPVAKPESKSEPESKQKSSPAADEDKPKPPVDQATATFKRPPSVDQPTAMLKLGGAKPAAEPEAPKAPKVPESPTAPKSEREVERTSKFVALKPLDEPAPPKAGPAAPTARPPGPAPFPKAAEAGVTPQVGPERTTQQPLPPKPPLDLLAELTNTPAPRQTPVRTIVRRVKIWTPLVLLLAVVFAVAQVVRPLPSPSLVLTADESYAFEGNKVSLPWPEEGQGWMDVNGVGTVDSFGEQKPVAIGSVAKAMTAYVILKEHPLKAGADGAKIPVDAKAEEEGGYDAKGESTLNTVKEGDTLTEKDAIAAIMIPSANNIARLLARWDANGSEAKFIDKMNAAAKDLGMTNTTYTDASGLKETTVSTAEDQVKLGNELVKIQALVDITKLPTWVDPSGRKWDNYNRLVPYNNAIGIKTGSTTKAGGNLLFAATQEVGGENVIVVGAILGQHTPPIIDTVNAVSKTAMIAAQEALTSQKILKKGDVVGYVDDGLGGQAPVVATKDVSAVGWAGQTVKLKLSEDGTSLPHEAKAGTKVGSLSVGDGTTGDAVEVPVALQSDLAEPGFGAKLTRVA